MRFSCDSERQSVVSRLGASTRGHNKYSSFWSDCVFAVVTVKIITVPTPTQEILRTRDRGGGRGYLLRVVLLWDSKAGAASTLLHSPCTLHPILHPPADNCCQFSDDCCAAAALWGIVRHQPWYRLLLCCAWEVPDTRYSTRKLWSLRIKYSQSKYIMEQVRSTA